MLSHMVNRIRSGYVGMQRWRVTYMFSIIASVNVSEGLLRQDTPGSVKILTFILILLTALLLLGYGVIKGFFVYKRDIDTKQNKMKCKLTKKFIDSGLKFDQAQKTAVRADDYPPEEHYLAMFTVGLWRQKLILEMRRGEWDKLVEGDIGTVTFAGRQYIDFIKE